MKVENLNDLVDFLNGIKHHINCNIVPTSKCDCGLTSAKLLATTHALEAVFKQPTTLDGYQEAASRTAPMALTQEMRLATFAMGLAGEAGEVVDLLKKHLGHGHPLDTEKLCKELGDVLWYVAALAGFFELKLSEVAQANVEKLKARYPAGFSPEASQQRDKVQS